LSSGISAFNGKTLPASAFAKGNGMVTYTVNVASNKMAIAEEVISSAGNILVAAGFAPNEIAALFRAASEQLTSGAAISVSDEYHSPEQDHDSMDLDDLRNAFESTDASKKLEKLKRRADALDRPHDSPDALKKCYDIVLKMLPLIGEMQKWLIATASEAKIEVVENQSDWTETASDEDLDREHEIIFLDAFDWTYPLNFQLVDDVASELVDKGEVDAFNGLSDLISSYGITLPNDLIETLEKGHRTLDLKDVFRSHVLQQSDEILETKFLEDFVRNFDFPHPSYFLQGWLTQMEGEGLINRYKSSNRWRIQVI